MKSCFSAYLLALVALFFFGCGDDDGDDHDHDHGGAMGGHDHGGAMGGATGGAAGGAMEDDDVVWDESDADQGELSGDPGAPTSVTFSVGDNYIVATSVPGAEEQCIETPDGNQAPYYPGHEPYTDVITFTLPAGQTLTNIHVEELSMEAVHPACGMPIEMQLGAFVGLAASDQIDWTSDTFENFIKLPEANPLVAAAFAKNEGEDLMAAFKAGFTFGPYMIPALAADPTDGTFTFWWKEGANRATYRLNFVVAGE